MSKALIALAVVAFGLGTAEFATMGLLPQIAHGTGVSIPQAGWLISVYAIGVVIGALLLTALAARTTRISRKTVLIGFAAIFTLGNLLSAIAPNFGFLAVARVIAGLPHGAFFGAGAVAAAELAAPNKQARAVAMMFAGLTVATIVGVPGATLVGQHLGWRATMLAIAAIGALGTFALWRLMPELKPRPQSGLRGELKAFRSGQLWLALATVLIGCGGFFACYSYITPMLTDVAGFSDSTVPLILALFGVGMTLGNIAGGYAADRALRPSICAAFLSLAAVLALFTVIAHVQWAATLTVVAVGFCGFAIVPTVQTLVMQKAGDAPALASAAMQAAFNLANAAGAYLGGLAIAAGFGLTSPNLVGAGLVASGFVVAAVSWAADRHRGTERAASTVVQAAEAASDRRLTAGARTD
ncbi:MFS transporter [Streptomyces tuirus]|uniref:MFS transporter n=1 Tax=Streptomyces tuirus TaxID=68278 RepID=A0A941FFZ6_9ACTN|nr:MFS transporter [Streptomyces tuirus]